MSFRSIIKDFAHPAIPIAEFGGTGVGRGGLHGPFRYIFQGVIGFAERIITDA